MAEDLRDSVHRLIRESYRPFRDSAELVSSFAEVALAATRSTRVVVSLRHAPDVAGDLRIVRDQGGAAQAGSPLRELLFPILYQNVEMGDLALVPPEPSLDSGDIEAGRVIAKALAHHLKRHEVRGLAWELYGKELGLIGTSSSLRGIDHFVERASQRSLPSLILGAPGSEAGGVPLALHLASLDRERPFVCVNCATFESDRFERQWLSRVSSADGGTLLLNRLEELERPLQPRLCEILESGLAGWTQARTDRRGEPRLVATASPELEELARNGGFYKPLLDQLDFLRLEIEPLGKRREDVEPLIEHYLRVHASGPPPRISDEALELLTAYSWPGNVAELSRIVGRLAVMAEDGCIGLHHLASHAPQILRAAGAETRGSLGSLPAAGGAQDRRRRHPSLQRAVSYINDHYQTQFSLAEVAAGAYVSVSHLEYLFRQELGTTFVRYLNRLRIERAQSLLIDRPHAAITAIAGDAGFNDLRHFERMFKRIAGCTPKEFRSVASVRDVSPDPPDPS